MKKLSISNIAWDKEFDDIVYEKMSRYSFSGLEIAPTRLFENPYAKLKEAKEFSKKLMEENGLEICSMQSVWYGIQNEIFASKSDRDFLLEYSKKAACFAEAISCKNIVFGCPKNRNLHSPSDIEISYDFFIKLADICKEWGVMLSIEPNPEIYGTNFLNYTQQTVNFARELNHTNAKVNADLGTIISNNEDFSVLQSNTDIINHIHISEPFLDPIEKRDIHLSLKELSYDNYISIEMKNCKDINVVFEKIEYVGELYR